MTETIKLFSSLGSLGRLQLVKKLENQGPQCVQELLEGFEGSQPHLSRQLGTLREAGVVRVAKSGNRRVYSLSEGVPDLIRFAEKVVEQEKAP